MMCIILLGLIAGYREVIHLCQRGSWSFNVFRSWFWFTDQNNKKVSNWDSFHVSNGLYVLVLCIFCTTCTMWPDFWLNGQIIQSGHESGHLMSVIVLIDVLILWVVYMWTRNIMMHVILPLKPDFRYLIPLVGTLIKK